MITIKQTLAANLRLIRGDRGQKEMAEIYGIDVTTYGRTERGDTYPSDETLNAICSSLGVSQLALVQDQSALPLPITREESDLTAVGAIAVIASRLQPDELQTLLTAAKTLASKPSASILELANKFKK